MPSMGGTPAEAEIQHLLAERLTALGLTVDLWPIDLADLRSRADFPGEEVDRTQAWGLVATNRPDERPALILQGHVDVVPPGDLARWTGEPVPPGVRDGRVVGRGACDMKGGVAAILGAVEAALSGGADVPPFAVHFVVGEEDGGLGAYATLARGHVGDACVIPEPHRPPAGHGQRRLAHLPDRGPGSGDPRQHPLRGALGDRRLPADPRGPRRARAAPQRRSRAAAAGLSDRLPAVGGPAPGRGLGEQRAGPARRGGPLRLRIDEDPATARAELEAAVAEAAAGDPYLRDHPPRVSWPGGVFRGGGCPRRARWSRRWPRRTMR